MTDFTNLNNLHTYIFSLDLTEESRTVDVLYIGITLLCRLHLAWEMSRFFWVVLVLRVNANVVLWSRLLSILLCKRWLGFGHWQKLNNVFQSFYNYCLSFVMIFDCFSRLWSERCSKQLNNERSTYMVTSKVLKITIIYLNIGKIGKTRNTCWGQ